MVVNVCNPSNLETGAGGLFQIQRLVWDTQRIQGNPEPHSKILSKQTSKSSGGGIMCCIQCRGVRTGATEKTQNPLSAL